MSFDGATLTAWIEAMPLGMFAIRDGVMVWCNSAFAALAERTSAEIVGQGFVTLVAPEDRAFVVDRYRRRLAGEAVPDHYEFSVMGQGERRRAVFMVVKVATVGEARYSVGTVVDVTVQAELAAGLRPDVASAPLPATPVLRVAAGVLVVPLVGHFHADRVRALTTDVLAAIGEQRAHALILDVTGLLDADARVADYLPRTADAARLLGARCIVAGVSPALAQVLVAQAGSLGRLATAASLEDAVKMAQDRR